MLRSVLSEQHNNHCGRCSTERCLSLITSRHGQARNSGKRVFVVLEAFLLAAPEAVRAVLQEAIAKLALSFRWTRPPRANSLRRRAGRSGLVTSEKNTCHNMAAVMRATNGALASSIASFTNSARTTRSPSKALQQSPPKPSQ